MRLANLEGRLVLVTGDEDERGMECCDVEEVSGGRFGSDPQAVYDQWEDFARWASSTKLVPTGRLDPDLLGPPVPRPRQIFAIGLNYRDHARESGFDQPTGVPPVFTKFRTALAGPRTTVVLPPGGNTDWEIELVAVIGRQARRVSAERGWDHVAGLMVGQDLSERVAQLAGAAPQFSLAKSHPGFAPTGPWLVTLDEANGYERLELTCVLNGEVVQHAFTDQMLVGVPALIAQLSEVVTLLPGDLVFTGTPAGVALGRSDGRYLRAGDELVSTIAGLGELRQRFVDDEEGA